MTAGFTLLGWKLADYRGEESFDHLRRKTQTAGICLKTSVQQCPCATQEVRLERQQEEKEGRLERWPSITKPDNLSLPLQTHGGGRGQAPTSCPRTSTLACTMTQAGRHARMNTCTHARMHHTQGRSGGGVGEQKGKRKQSRSWSSTTLGFFWNSTHSCKQHLGKF